ncbi:hypothetical protein FACS18948_7400 [Clostridia bacterium]|nr:hypothetical protein FACS18948_7400 [Clostridia bacterium]
MGQCVATNTFKRLELTDRDLILPYLRRFPENESSECTFSNLFIWADGDDVRWLIRDDTLLIHTLDANRSPCLMMAFPHPECLCEGLELAVSVSRQNDGPFRMCSLPDWYVARMEACSPGRFVFEREPHHDDYVYETSALINLQGRDLHAKRNHINKFNNLFQGRYSFEEYTLENFAECMDAYYRWFSEHGEDAELQPERLSVENALRNCAALGLRGGLIRVDGKVEAFTIGERITSDMCLIHIEKANTHVQGLFSVINQQYLQYIFPDTTWVNREEDMGIEGLRRAKRSYRPARMIEKYGAVLAE